MFNLFKKRNRTLYFWWGVFIKEWYDEDETTPIINTDGATLVNEGVFPATNDRYLYEHFALHTGTVMWESPWFESQGATQKSYKRYRSDSSVIIEINEVDEAFMTGFILTHDGSIRYPHRISYAQSNWD